MYTFAFSVLGAFPWHLLSLFPMLGALQFRSVDIRLRWMVGAVSAGLLVLGVAGDCSGQTGWLEPRSVETLVP